MAPTADEIDALLEAVAFDGQGLAPAVAQQRDTGEVLMLAWMNPAALAASLRTGEVHYWSRSRQELWRKGASSGQVQKLVEVRLDCDSDALLLVVEQTGVACHTGRRSCFYRVPANGRWRDALPVETAPATLYGTPQDG